MLEKRERLLVGWATILILLSFLFLPLATVHADDPGNTDKTSVLTDFVATIKQNGNEIGEGGSLTSKNPVSIEISFGVPVEGDDPEPANPVRKNDTAVFPISNAFTLISNDTITLKSAEKTVGHVTFTTDPITQMVYANILFDGDDEVFTDFNSVTCKFTAALQYDDSGDAGNVGDHEVEILEKTYFVNVPPQEIIYNVTKTGTVDLAR
ncbi:MAG: hypothetical protein ACOX05_00105 [Bacillota bacterium]|jgi:hypothetical protein